MKQTNLLQSLFFLSLLGLAQLARAEIYSDDFSSGDYSGGSGDWGSNWAEVYDDNSASSGNTYITSAEKLRIGASYDYVYRSIDLSTALDATLSFTYQGSNLNNSRYVTLYFYNGSWQGQQTLSSNSSETISVSIDSAFLTSDFRIAFQASGDSSFNNSNRYIEIDDIVISTTEENSDPEPLAFFELSDSDGSITDSLNNVSNGTLIADAEITDADDASACLAGYIPFNDDESTIDAIDTGIDVNDDIGNTGTVMFWYQSSSSSDSARQLLDASTRVNRNNGNIDAEQSKMFFLTLNDDDLHFRLEDSDDSGRIAEITNVETNDSTGNPAWVFVAVTWDLSNNEHSVYILEPEASTLRSATNTNSSSGAIGELDTLYIGDNRSTYFSGVSTENSADGYFDDIRIFKGALSDSEILTYAESVRICDPEPDICFEDNFDDGDLGVDWAVTNRTTNTSASFSNPVIVDNRLRLTSAEKSLSTAATLMRLFPSSGNKMVINFTHYAYNGTGADGLAIVLSTSEVTPQPGAFGQGLGYAQLNTSIDGFAGGWLGIGIDEWGNFTASNFGKSGGFSRIPDTVTIRGSGSGTDGYNYIVSNGNTPSSTTAPSGLSPEIENTSGHKYRITIDHENSINAWATIERDYGNGYEDIIESFDLLAQADQDDIPDKLWLTITGSTGGATNIHEVDDLKICAWEIEDVSTEYIDHYELDRDYQTGLTCEPLNITVRACLDDDSLVCSQYSDSLTTEFSPTSGWATSNTKTGYSSGASFEFQQTTASEYSFDILSSSPSVEPLSTDYLRCFVSGVEQSNCTVEFVDAAYRFFESASGTNSISTLDLIAADESDPLYVRAIKTDEATGQCVNVSNSDISVASMVGTLCSSTSACLAGEPVIWSQDSSSYSLANPTDQNGGNDYTDIDISFDSNDTATFNVTAPDVGIQPLTIKTEITDVDGNTTGEYIEGTVNLRVRPASILIQETAVDSATTWIASDDFNLVISGLDANGDPAPSFGRITGLYDIDWSGSTLAGPTAGVLGTIGGGSSASQWSGTDYTSGNDAITESIQASISYSEAGEVNLVASIENYLGSSYDLTTSAYQAGRFTPAYLTATQNNAGSAEWGTEDANIYQGQSAALSDLSYTVQAFNSDGGLIKNYVGNYVNFSDTTNALSKPGNTADNNYDDIGGDLTSSLAWTISDDSDFDGTITLNAEVSDLLWSRSSTGATTKDIATDISDLNIIADAFTDADDVCVKSSASDTACQNVTADIEDRTLYFVRANLPDLVDGGFNRAEIDITLEALELDTYGDIDWDTLSTDNDLDSSVFTGLSYDSALHSCTLQPSSNCSDVASSALFSGPESIGSNLSSGLGLFTASSTTDLEGSLELQLSAPDWLSWDWNSDGTYTLDETTILFGNYQGQAPVLFMRPGYR